MTKKWIVRKIGGGEDMSFTVEADTREEAIEKAPQFPWYVRKVTARPAKEGEHGANDPIELKWHVE